MAFAEEDMMKALMNHPHGYVPAFEGLSFVDDALRTFDRVLRNPAFGRAIPSAWASGPDVAIETGDAGWVLRAELPGLAPDALEVEVHGERLTLRGRRNVEIPEGFRPVYRERAALGFERSFEFGRGFDAAGVTAELKNGVLRVTVPRRPEERARAITVTAG